MENERSWDGHVDIAGNHRQFAGETDTPIAGLLTDLKQRGLLESTLVICDGEFGRLPIVAKRGQARPRPQSARLYHLAGRRRRQGRRRITAQTDELGFKAAVDRVSVNDLHATILHLLGIDHERLTYRYNGRDFRLTDVAGSVVRTVVG